MTNTDNDAVGHHRVADHRADHDGEPAAPRTFTVVLTSQPTAAVTIELSSSDPTEGTVPASITFAPAAWNVAQTVTVTGVDDALASDGDVAYTIVTHGDQRRHRSTTRSTRRPTSRSPTLDNDGAGITVTPTAGLITTEAARDRDVYGGADVAADRRRRRSS